MEQDRQSPDPPRDEDERRARGLLDVLQRELAGEETIIAGRYVLGDRIGVGAHGSVHAALDRLTGERVAVKLLPPAVDLDLVRLRGEIAALRLLRLPGVVHLFDEGVDHGRPFLVMERVDGVPFPGALPEGATRWTWEALRGPTLALLDTLARVHAAGLVHRDLKPRNVLVTAAGRPMLLDFGLTVGRALAEDSASDTSALGTPAYAAPEQVRGESVDARADLYSLGVMLWEALAGRRPHEGPRVSGILRARLAGPVESIERAAPGVPHEVAEVVDTLLEVEREARPRSAVEVGERLRGGPTRSSEWLLPLVGRKVELRILVEAALGARSAIVVGRPGSGRTRLLTEVSSELERRGRRVAWLPRRERPFESMSVLAAWLEDPEPASGAEAHKATLAALHRAVAAGLVVVADDLELMDVWSQRVLREGASGAAILMSTTPSDTHALPAGLRVDVGPLREADLPLLFVGNDRLQHVHEDAAHELRLRTDCLPASVDDELFSWWCAGLLDALPAGLRITRVAIDKLRGGLPIMPARTVEAPVRPLDDDLDELLAWCHLAWPNTGRELLLSATRREAWLLDAELEELERRGAVRVLDDGRVRPLRASRRLAEQSWVADARVRAHATLAELLKPGSTGRLYHLIAASRHDEAAAEACRVARDHRCDGRLSEAEAALAEGRRAVRHVTADRAGTLEHQLLAEWLAVAISSATSVPGDRLLYELSRDASQDPRKLHLARLVRASVAAYRSGGAQSLRAIEAVAAFDDEELETWRHALRMRVARRCAVTEHERVLREARAWAAQASGELAGASLQEWEGLFHYRQGRYREAADCHIVAAEQARRTTGRLSALLNAASALLELPALTECEKLANDALDLAKSCRHALFEGRSAWLVRSAAYRRGDNLAPDVELVDALEAIGMPEQAALAALNEAAVAWRCGQAGLAAELAERAARDWVGSAMRDGVLLARSLALAAGSTGVADAGELQAMALQSALPLVGAQALALLSFAGVEDSPDALPMIRQAAVRGRRYGWDTRFEVLSLDEILARCGLSRSDVASPDASGSGA